MALKALVDSLASVPESLRGEYVEVKDGDDKGKFALAVEAVGNWGLDNVVKLKASIQKERELREKFEREVTKWKDLDPDRARAALAELERLKDAVPKDQLEAAVARSTGEVKKQLEAEIAKRDKGLEKSRLAIRNLTIRAEAARAFAEFKGNADLLMPHLDAIADVREDEGRDVPSAFIKGPDGIPLATRKQGSDGRMSISEYVGTVMRDRFPQAFEGTSHNGAGSSGGGGGGASRGGQIILSRADAKNPEKWDAAHAEAKKTGATVAIAAT